MKLKTTYLALVAMLAFALSAQALSNPQSVSAQPTLAPTVHALGTVDSVCTTFAFEDQGNHCIQYQWTDGTLSSYPDSDAVPVTDSSAANMVSVAPATDLLGDGQ
jgi:hypothetical protein